MNKVNLILQNDIFSYLLKKIIIYKCVSIEFSHKIYYLANTLVMLLLFVQSKIVVDDGKLKLIYV